MFELTFLGTSAGVPSKARNVSALALSCVNPYLSDGSSPWVLVDCGEGTQHQLLQTPLSGQSLVAICITHLHGDHCYGLPGLLASISMIGRTRPLTLIAQAALQPLLIQLLETTACTLNYPLHFIAIEERGAVDQSPIVLTLDETHSLEIAITPLSHRLPSVAFQFTQKIIRRRLDTEKLQTLSIPTGHVWGQLQRGEDVALADRVLRAEDFLQTNEHTTCVVVAGDNDRPELLQEAVQPAAVLVHEATYLQAVAERILERRGFDPMHSSVEKISQFAERAGLKNLILTHFSARYQPFYDANSDTPNMAHIQAEARANYSGNLWLAADFSRFRAEGDTVTAL